MRSSYVREHWLGRRTSGCWIMITLGFIMGVVFWSGTALAGTLEPPASAVDGAGNPVATGATPPAWDKVLPANDTGDPCRSSRFICVMGGTAVLDNETGVVWERAPETSQVSREDARLTCLNKNVAGRKGWRLPSVQELSSLVDVSTDENGLNLPPGHPFTLNSIGRFAGHWSATTDAQDPNRAWSVNFDGGIVKSSEINLTPATDHSTFFYTLFWCVRGGGPLSEY
ncbi:MAG: DUF1566 domain-containing protein [Nitrospirales bacterium]|nr:DUF1566 domain-containing protein [Nitrospira sp.]MDR4459015.1 DUF1566 domain-containing protein [Nitrospirales bacterium]MDR4483609.1 DUF1566 domain-containing protein [Nitrospirales bacterium]